MAKPKQNTQRLVVYISPELEKSFQDEAEKKGTNVSNLVRVILTEREVAKTKCGSCQRPQIIEQFPRNRQTLQT